MRDEAEAARASNYAQAMDRANARARAALGRATSRAETGFIGLSNQGATCYLNSLIQTLYHLAAFRDIVYHVDEAASTTSGAGSGAGAGSGDLMLTIPLALQRLFYRLQTSAAPVSTRELTTGIARIAWVEAGGLLAV